LKRSETRFALAAAGLAIAFVSGQLVVNFDLQIQPYIDDTTYTHGLYVQYETKGTIVTNDGLIGSELFAVSGRPYLPVGGSTTAFQSPELLIFGYLDSSRLRIGQIPLSELTVESDSPYQLLGVQAEADWADLLGHPQDSIPPRLISVYHPVYLMENWAADGGYFAYGKTYPSPFVTSVHEDCYKIFEVTGQSLWYLGDHR